MAETKIPKTANCDALISAILDVVVFRNSSCIVLSSYQITATEVVLTWDAATCAKKTVGAGADNG